MMCTVCTGHNKITLCQLKCPLPTPYPPHLVVAVELNIFDVSIWSAQTTDMMAAMAEKRT